MSLLVFYLLDFCSIFMISLIKFIRLLLIDIIIFAILVFGSFGNEPVQSCSVCCVVLSSVLVLLVVFVYSSPRDSFNHRNSISCKYIHLYS